VLFVADGFVLVKEFPAIVLLSPVFSNDTNNLIETVILFLLFISLQVFLTVTFRFN
jgi:hypothetical protein